MDPISQPIITSPAPTVRQKNNKPLIILIVVLLLAASAFAAVRIQQSRNGESDTTISPTVTPVLDEIPTDTPVPETPTPEVTKAPTATPRAEVKAATDMNLQILNGSGEVGVASSAQTHLEGKGYEYFETGNADNFDYQGVLIRIKPTMQKYLTKLQSDLSDKYTLATDSGTLTNDALFDAVIVVGK